jgi:serpin B
MSNEQLTQTARGLNALGFRWIQATDHRTNVVLSPYDIGMALSLVELAASGETRAEIDRALGFDAPGSSISALPALAEVVERAGRRPGFALASAARAWPSTRLRVLDSYRDAIARHAGAPVVSLDFAANPEAQRRTINEWVSQQTSERIPELLSSDSIHAHTRFVLTTALYFLGRWKEPFDVDSTRDDAFFLDASRAKIVPMMCKPLGARYVQDGAARMIELDYAGEELAMNVIVPSPGHSLEEVQRSLDPERYQRLLRASRTTSVNVRLPRFTLEETLPLRDRLEAIGVRTMFTEAADLRRLTDSAPLWIGSVVHKTFVAVDERGAEAAAATATQGYGAGSIHVPVFAVHQPFIFVLRHKSSGAILVLGRVVDPAPSVEARETSGSPLAPGAHDPMSPSVGGGLLRRSGIPPQVRWVPSTLRGSIPRSIIGRVMQRHHGELLHCYERGLAINPNAIARVEFSLTIGPDGSVQSASMSDEFPIPETIQCMTSAARRWQFPRPAHGGTASAQWMLLLSPPE